MQLSHDLSVNIDGHPHIMPRCIFRNVAEGKTDLRIGQGLVCRPATADQTPPCGVGDDQILDSPDRLAFVEHRLHSGVIAL